MRVLYIATELKPFSQAGGVGDVAGELPFWLRREGVDIEVVVPMYSSMRLGDASLRLTDSLLFEHGGRTERVLLYRTSKRGVPVTLIGNRNYFQGAYGQPYVHSPSIPFYDDVLRFYFFSEVCMALLASRDPDIVHVNDWGPSFLLGRMLQEGRPARRVLTVHNIGYQGNIGLSALRGLPPERLLLDDLIEPLSRDPRPEWQSANPLRLGLEAAQMANTVSPTYCQEIIRPDDPGKLFLGGQGLEEVAAGLHSQRRLTGILNGFDSQSGPSQTGFEETLETKRAMKAVLAQDFPDPDSFLLGFVGRACEQKCRLLMEELHGRSLLAALLDLPGINLAVLTSGTRLYEDFFAGLSNRPNVSLSLGFDPERAELISSGCDLFLMPSLFEPCGIAQLASMSRATPPLVRSIGGLADTVIDQRHSGGNGFVFAGNSRGELLSNLLATVQRARDLKLLAPQEFARLQRNCYFRRFPWAETARSYVQHLYEPALSS